MATTNLHDRIASAIRRGDLFTGGLLHVDAEPASRCELCPPGHQWYVTTTVHSTLRAVFRGGSPQVVLRSDVLGVSTDWSCWVLSYRVGGFEHRCFLPLVGRQVKALLEDVPRTGIRVFLTDTEDESEVLIEAQVPVPEADASALRARWRPAPMASAPDRLLQTMDILLRATGTESAIVDTPLSRVCVTVVVPEDLDGMLADLMPPRGLRGAPGGKLEGRQ